MSKSLERFLLFFFDFILIQLAFFIWARWRWAMGFFAATSSSQLTTLSMIIYIYWLILFLFYGLYHIWYTRSRVDEFISVSKVVSIGLFLIFILTFDLEKDVSHPMQSSRMMILAYWILMVFFVGTGRVLLRSLHRKLLEKGIGRRKALIVGWGQRAKELFNMVQEAPALGYDIVGFVHQEEYYDKGIRYKKVPVRGPVNRLNEFIHKLNIQDILIALPRRSEKRLEEVMAQCDGTPVGLKIVPDHYDMILGQVRTNQLYGFPLIEIFPQLMEPWEHIVKRWLDIGISLTAFVLFLFLSPFWIPLLIVMQFTAPGPVFYTQERVGKNGKTFKIYKFRTMIKDAEKVTGPVWATDDDPRIPMSGKIMRRFRMDEIPQIINILNGTMSIVGPRPERPHFVEMLRKEIPLYSRRLRIRPGLTGWAQVKGEYDQTIEDVKKKLEFDLFYIENMSLRMDIKIMINTILVMLKGKGK
jgi:exopolysaccharide biosynthesis polyprenyl glycosylphosphotransferase